MNNRKSRFNFFDAIIFLLVVAVLAFAFFYISGRSKVGAEVSNTKVTYKVEFRNVIDDVKDSARVGDPARDGVKKTKIGTITGVQLMSNTRITTNKMTGEAIRTVIPGSYRVVLTCEADAIVENGKVMIGSYDLLIGKQIFLQSRNFSGSGYCIGIQYGEGSGH